MDYELAKQLHDAGFPFQKTSIGFEMVSEHVRYNESPLAYRVPTLEELIEACGDEFILLKNMMLDRWYAKGYIRKPKIKERHISTYELSPKVAVAKLWLEINKTP